MWRFSLIIAITCGLGCSANEHPLNADAGNDGAPSGGAGAVGAAGHGGSSGGATGDAGDAPSPEADGGLPPAAMCTSTPVTATEANSVASLGENIDTTCASVVGIFAWKMHATGSACTSPLDCSPVCCPCPNGTQHTLAAWCDHGQCATGDRVSCMVLGSPLKSCM
jgi:hypothetical protein